MSETIDKLVKQHEVIGVKTDCKYFSNVGNLCSRVENSMMRCDEYLECEFKYIDALKEENEQLQKRFNDYQDRKIEENADLIKRLDIADKKLTVFSRELEQANKENEKLKQYLLNIGMIIEELEQQYDDIKDFTEIKEIKEILREVNQ